MASRIAIGCSYWFLMVLTLGGWLIRKPLAPRAGPRPAR
jgi:hypothetical protein